MRILGIFAKMAFSIAAMFYLHPDGLGSGVVIFAAVYGFATWFLRYVVRGGIQAIITDGLIFGLIYALFVPALALVAPMFILEAIFSVETGDLIYSICIVALCAGCLIRDIVGCVRMFRPEPRKGEVTVTSPTTDHVLENW